MIFTVDGRRAKLRKFFPDEGRPQVVVDVGVPDLVPLINRSASVQTAAIMPLRGSLQVEDDCDENLGQWEREGEGRGALVSEIPLCSAWVPTLASESRPSVFRVECPRIDPERKPCHRTRAGKFYEERRRAAEAPSIRARCSRVLGSANRLPGVLRQIASS